VGSGGDTMAPKSTDRRFAASIPNAPSALARLRLDVSRFLAGLQVDEAAVHAVELVLEELVGNTLRYGYADDAAHAIDVELDVGPAGILVRLRDDARPFDPTRHAVPAPPASLAEAPVGGRGIALVRACVRAMRYRREAAANVLEVEIERQPPAGSRAGR